MTSHDDSVSGHTMQIYLLIDQQSEVFFWDDFGISSVGAFISYGGQEATFALSSDTLPTAHSSVAAPLHCEQFSNPWSDGRARRVGRAGKI